VNECDVCLAAGEKPNVGTIEAFDFEGGSYWVCDECEAETGDAA
jgi:hypothetical protein